VAHDPDSLSRGDKGARQPRRWLQSEIPLGTLLETPYGVIPEEAEPLGLRVRTHETPNPDDELPAMPYTVNRREQVWTPRLAHLVEQTNAGQWNAALDIPWSEADANPDDIEEAVCEVFTWLLQQELVAHEVPASWLSRINPQFLEVKLFLSGKVMDEARHADVCVRRLWINGHGPAKTPPDTDNGLAPLTQLEDYEQASLLVDILGEGQILDVFKIIHDLSPDPATRQIVLLSRRDEARHVSYGVARLAHRLATGKDSDRFADQVVEWIAERAESSNEFSDLPENVQEALHVLGDHAGIDARQRAREFPDEAARFRRQRLEAAGLPPKAQKHLSEILAPSKV
jgi:hypothetical protein